VGEKIFFADSIFLVVEVKEILQKNDRPYPQTNKKC
jgi:hypothetical protein